VIRAAAAAFASLCFFTAPCLADPPAALGRVAEVVDGDTLRIADGSEARLLGVLSPKPLPKDRRSGPLVETARARLAALALGRAVEPRGEGAFRDRHGRLLAQLYRDDGVWLQGEMLRSGLARVDSAPESRAAVPAMLALEREARAARRGLWADPAYAVRTADEAARYIDSFQLVEGTVLEAVKAKGQVFLNFGADWRSDFTIRIPGPALKLFRTAALDPLALKGRKLRVRGWLRAENGPMIDATYPEQIELVEP
jgi:micrococcal nuclease